MLVRITNREDPDQTASSEAVWSQSALFVEAFLAGNKVFEILEHLYCNQKIIFLFLNQNICCGYSKDP